MFELRLKLHTPKALDLCFQKTARAHAWYLDSPRACLEAVYAGADWIKLIKSVSQRVARGQLFHCQWKGEKLNRRMVTLMLFSSIQCFTSTETVRKIRDGEPGTSTSTFTQLLNFETESGLVCSLLALATQTAQSVWIQTHKRFKGLIDDCFYIALFSALEQTE